MCCRAIFYLCAFEHPIEDMTRGAAAGLGGGDGFLGLAARRLARLGAARAWIHFFVWVSMSVVAQCAGDRT